MELQRLLRKPAVEHLDQKNEGISFNGEQAGPVGMRIVAYRANGDTPRFVSEEVKAENVGGHVSFECPFDVRDVKNGKAENGGVKNESQHGADN